MLSIDIVSGVFRVLALALACGWLIVSPLPIAADALEQDSAPSFDKGGDDGEGARLEIDLSSGEGSEMAADGCSPQDEARPFHVAALRTRGEQALDRINGHRAVAGLAPLTVNEELSRAAARHSEEMARRSLMTHAGIDGSNPVQRVRAEGYRGRGVGEVVAMGFADGDQVVAAWMASPEHRTLLLSPRFREVSVGVAESASGSVFWTADLGIPQE